MAYLGRESKILRNANQIARLMIAELLGFGNRGR